MINQIEPWINEEELVELKRVTDSTFLTEANLTREFEGMTRSLTGAKHSIAMMNGTVALFCSMKALGIGPGDEVIVPDMTFIATANAVIMAGAKPIFCDVYPDTFCIDVERAEGTISEHTKAIIPVHLYGQSADMVKIKILAHKYNLRIIEDAAQGIGVTFENRHVGTLGDLGVLSFYGNKTITCGEGGMVLTNDDELASKCYRLKNHGRDKKGIFVHEDIGYNFSFTEMQAAVGISQMKKLSKIISRKKVIHELYRRALANLDRLLPVHIDNRTEPVYWFTSFLSDDVDELSKYLLESDIQTRRFFYPLHLQPCYKNNEMFAANKRNFPVSEDIYKRGISLPSSYTLKEEEQTFVIKKIEEFYANRY